MAAVALTETYFQVVPRSDSRYVELRDFRPLESLADRRACWRRYLLLMDLLESAGYDGWIGWVEASNEKLRVVLRRMGAIEYGQSDDGLRIYVRRLARKPYGTVR